MKKNNFRILLMVLVWCVFLLINAGGKKSYQSEIEKIEDLLKARYTASEPGAAVLVAREGEPLVMKAYGMADLEKRIPLSTDHSFALGSVSKQFTAMAILILWEQGKLSLDDDLVRYFPEAFNFRGVKIHHLLTHSSGIMDLFRIQAWYRDLSEDLSKEETLEMIFNEELEFRPGEKTSYSNSGYFVLGVICEIVTGTSLNQFMEKHIFSPLGMSHTCFLDSDPPGIPTAVGYEKRDSICERAFQVSPTRFYGGGSIVTTLEDLLKWDESLYSNRLLSDFSRKILFNPFALTNNQMSRSACGWEILNFGNLKIYGHGGGTTGFVSQVYRIPGEHIYVAIMSNLLDRGTQAPVSTTAQQIIKILLEDLNKESLAHGIIIPVEELALYTGYYKLPNGSIRKILIEGAKIYYETGPGKQVELMPQSRSIFKAGMASTINFSFNDEKNIDKFEIHTGKGRSVTGIKIKPEENVSLTVAEMERFAGIYRMQDGEIEKTRKIELRNDQLFYVVNSRTYFLLKPESKTSFNLNTTSTKLKFDLNKSHEVSKLTIVKGSGGLMEGVKIK